MWDVHSGWTGERTCPHCGAQLQSASHAFFECPFFEKWREEQEEQEEQEGVARFVAGCQQLAVCVCGVGCGCVCVWGGGSRETVGTVEGV